MQVDDKIWARVTWYWSSFSPLWPSQYLCPFSLPLETWVNFKVFGLTALTFN